MKQESVKLPSVELELVDHYVDAEVRCRVCGTFFQKTTFKDGDGDSCLGCGVEHWFELRDDKVLAHKVENADTGLKTLSAALSALGVFR
jgi:hypothetical protein